MRKHSVASQVPAKQFIFHIGLASALVVCGLVLSTRVQAEELTDTRKQELVHLLKHDCGSCHGMTMQGGLGPDLLPASIAKWPQEVLELTILNGRPGTPMPGWRGLLSETDVRYLIRYLANGEDLDGS